MDFILFYFSHLWILDIPSFLAESRKEHIQTAKHSLEAKTKLVRATWSLKVVRLRLLEPVFQASGGKLRLSHRVAGMGVEGGQWQLEGREENGQVLRQAGCALT